MYYEVSNVVFNHKPTEWEITHKNPFHASKKSKVGNEYFLVEDKPQNLFKMFQLGHCIKPHTPTTLKEAIAHTIILDSDNLTKGQCDFVKSIVNGAYGFMDGMCGDHSAGTKARLHENKDIPNYEPPKWGYKVFCPIERVVIKEEVYDAFLEAVAFFNPRKWDKELMVESRIRLPATLDGKPDWKWMENHIKGMPYSAAL